MFQEETHWERDIVECTVAARLPDAFLHLPLYGCSDNGQFCHISPRIDHNRIYYHFGRLNAHTIILEIQGYKVSGYTYMDLEELIQSLTANSEPILIKTIPNNYLPSILKEYLNQIFPLNSFDHDLQRVIRDNVYLRVVPCTTRKPRLGEISGIDYQFLAVSEFLDLDKSDGLLESGVFDGNYYGTPKPISHYKHLPNNGSLDDNPSLPSSTDLDDWELGPLPDKWEIAFTEDNYRYFIDHNSGTTQWNDPRLPTEVNEEVEKLPILGDLHLTESLPYGWEKVYDPMYGIFYIDHNNKRTQYDPPATSSSPMSTAPFTNDPSKLRGSFARTTLIKSPRGFGFTIIGGSDRHRPEFLQIKQIMSGGPAAEDGLLETGDVLVSVDRTLVLGYLHADIVTLFQGVSIGQQVTLTVCKGYPMPLEVTDAQRTLCDDDLDDPRNGARVAVSSEGSSSSAKSSLSTTGSNCDGTTGNAQLFATNAQSEFIKINILKCFTGFGFTISDSSRGQRVKEVMDPSRCGRLREGDILMEINTTRVKEKNHHEVVQILKDCPEGEDVVLLIQRGGIVVPSSNCPAYSQRSVRFPPSQDPSSPPSIPHRTTGNTSAMVNTPSSHQHFMDNRGTNNDHSAAKYLYAQQQTYREVGTNRNVPIVSSSNRSRTPGPSDTSIDFNYYHDPSASSGRPKTPTAADMRTSYYGDLEYDMTPEDMPNYVTVATAGDSSQSECKDTNLPFYGSISRTQRFRNSIPSRDRIVLDLVNDGSATSVFFVTLNKQSNGFGFRIIGGLEDNSAITIGPLVPDGAALRSGQINAGDELISINGASVVGAYHKKVVQLVAAASRLGSVTLGLRRSPRSASSPNDRSATFEVTLTRAENEGFGFVIVTSITRSGSRIGEYIGKLIDNSPAQRCGQLRINDRILAVNGTCVSKMRHEKIVSTIKNCGRTVTLSICPMATDADPQHHRWHGNSEGSDHSSCGVSCPGGVDDFEITLARGSNGFGFSIRGGQDFNKMPLFVLRIAEDGPAKADGRLRVGDKILQINGQHTTGMTHSQAIAVIQAGGNTMTLLVHRSIGIYRPQPQLETARLPPSNSILTSTRPVMPPQYTDFVR